MKRIRDEQKGLIFLGLMMAILVAAVIIFILSLRTDNVTEQLDEDQVIRQLYVFEKDDGGVLFSSVLVYYPVTQKAAIVNVPSNTGAIYQSLGKVDAIEEVFRQKGIDSYRTEVAKLLGMNIPFYTVIKVSYITKLTDMLGGLRVFIPSPVNYTDEDGNPVLLPSGAVNLDGDKIMTYLTYRIPDDLESNEQERYQSVMAAILTGFHDKSYLVLNQKNFATFTEGFKTNLDADDSLRLFKMICNLDTESIIKQNITGVSRANDNKILLYPRENGVFIKTAVKQTTNMLTSKGGIQTSRIYVLEVQNGTTEQGLAGRTADLFRNASYDVLSPVNASGYYDKTVIIDHIGNEEIARMVGEFIHCTNIQEEEINTEEEVDSSSALVDFTVILGKDFNGRYVIPSSK